MPGIVTPPSAFRTPDPTGVGERLTTHPRHHARSVQVVTMESDGTSRPSSVGLLRACCRGLRGNYKLSHAGLQAANRGLLRRVA